MINNTFPGQLYRNLTPCLFFSKFLNKVKKLILNNIGFLYRKPLLILISLNFPKIKVVKGHLNIIWRSFNNFTT